MKNLSQKRAKHALDKVNEILEKHTNLNNKNFKSFAAGAPTIILQNGLGQALAFWASKMKSDKLNNEKYILDVIKSWFANAENPHKFNEQITDVKGFITIVLNKDQADYIKIQKETLAMLEWFKRYANAFLSEEKKKEGNED